MVSDVSPAVKSLNYWKNIGEVIRIASAFANLYEHIYEMNYNWMYYFDPCISLNDTNCFDNDHIGFGTFNGAVHNISYFRHISPIMELLLRDDKFYTAASIFLNSFESHWFCLHCEISKEPYKKHESHEPYKWEEASLIAKMESALVQSCRAVEALLGKPGRREDKAKVIRAKQRWKEEVNVNPDESYYNTNMSYYDYYYELFELRNSSSHSFGVLPFNVSRENTINAQRFSFLILHGYFEKNVLEVEEASKRLKFCEESVLNEKGY
ncbi:hypothetical protein V7138_21525 [Bacillus sp. JJ1533]|uniref:hypothetical protein n=1 Tax=Bacillus sp. JJ1533 TaxID=3122959 RepID=UPI0030006E19